MPVVWQAFIIGGVIVFALTIVVIGVRSILKKRGD